MAKLPKYTLSKSKSGGWDLTKQGAKRRSAHFDTKNEATSRGALREAVGGEGSVVIKKENGRIQEERTYPKSKDPSKSPG